MKEVRVKICPSCDTYVLEEMEEAFKYNWCPKCEYGVEAYSQMRQRVLDFAKDKHSGQVRKTKTGEKPIPYISHPITTMRLLEMKGLNGFLHYAGSLLHDTVEDTDATLEDIYDIAGDDVQRIVRILTKVKGVKTKEYLTLISQNEIAKDIKCADRLANLIDITTLDNENFLTFKQGYLKNTTENYSDFFKGSVFEPEYIMLIESLQSQIKEG